MTHDAFAVAPKTLRPTQMTVGFREVAAKRKEWRQASAKTRTGLLRSHVVPAVIGPNRDPHIVDHHHFARALLEEKVPSIGIYVLADLSHLPTDEFWTFLDNSAWCHAYDGEGRRRGLSDIPRKLKALRDDPYRSLVGALIRSGGCAKTGRPFFEFLWADFLRRRINRSLVADHYKEATEAAIRLAGSRDARSLPGWCPRE